MTVISAQASRMAFYLSCRHDLQTILLPEPHTLSGHGLRHTWLERRPRTAGPADLEDGCVSTVVVEERLRDDRAEPLTTNRPGRVHAWFDNECDGISQDPPEGQWEHPPAARCMMRRRRRRLMVSSLSSLSCPWRCQRPCSCAWS